MEYRRLGKSGLTVSEIALGSWLTYGTATEKQQSIDCVRQAYDLGVNHFDCSNVYGSEPHMAEAVLAEALAPYARESYVLTTKAFWPVGPGPNDKGLGRKHLMAQIDLSLTTLKVDYVDLFYCHRFDPAVDPQETLQALDDMVTQGKVLYAGLSEWPVEAIANGVQLQRELRLHKFAASQPVYNLFNRYIEAAVLPVCDAAGIGQVVFSPLAQGALTGKYRQGQPAPAGSRGAHPRYARMVAAYLEDRRPEQVEQLAQIAAEHGLSLAQLAIAWVLRQPSVASALVGASRPEQIVENVQASGVTLDAATLEQIEAVFA